MPGEIVDVVAFDAAYLKDHPELQPALRRVWARALAYMQSTPQEAIDIMSRREGISPDEFKAALDGLHLVSAEEQTAYFDEGGQLERATDFTIQTLTAIGDLTQLPGQAKSFIYP